MSEMTYDVDVTITYAQSGDVWPSRVVGRVGTEPIDTDWWDWVDFYNRHFRFLFRTFREVYV